MSKDVIYGSTLDDDNHKLISFEKDYLDDFIFHDKLIKTLKVFLDNPEIIRLSPILCFHGFPGVGKTSFSKVMCDDLCSDVQYCPMNERSLQSGFIEKTIKPLLRTRPVIGNVEKVFSRGIILDEFHNLTPKDQDRFKVVFDDVVNNELDTLVVVCLNTTNTKPVYKCLTKPIYSRVHPIDFNILDEFDELLPVVNKVIKRFPSLSRTQVYCWLPDMRKITRNGRISELMEKRNEDEGSSSLTPREMGRVIRE